MCVFYVELLALIDLSRGKRGSAMLLVLHVWQLLLVILYEGLSLKQISNAQYWLGV